MKKYAFPLLLLVVLGIVTFNLDHVTNYVARLVSSSPEVIVDPANLYMEDNDFIYVQKSKDFIPYSMQDLMNIFYSIFDNGYETFTFYCPSEYVDCLDDVEELTNDQTVITDIGNFVHPYNNFTALKVVTDSLGKVTVQVQKMYTPEMIEQINAKLDRIFDEQLTNDMALEDKILKIHDHIIDTTYYDQEDGENSGNAYGTLIEGKSKCAGYADSMAIALSKLGVTNYKVASSKHVWNAVYIDGGWSQIDLTWDDPIVQNGAIVTDTIRHKFYMIDTKTLLSYDTNEHSFDRNVYVEVR